MTSDQKLLSTDSITPLINFFESIFGASEGYAYSPTKHLGTGVWTEYYFKWPEEKQKLILHTKAFGKTHDVYFAPVLFSNEDSKKSFYKCSNVVWAEFDVDDGEIPEFPEGIPYPSLRIQSSTKGHEHWYWRLNFSIKDDDVLEKITKRIVYATGADYGWQCNKVLRPPYTVHQESGLPVHVIENNKKVYGPEAFIDLPPVPTDYENFKLGRIPDVLNVIAKYSWSDENFKFFRKAEQKEGSRSSALTRLSHTCIEMGMTNEETFAILLHADSRWKKFAGRADQNQRLSDIIRHSRSHAKTKVNQEEKRQKLKIYSFKDFCNTEEDIEWIVPGYFWKKCVAIIGGPPDVGKTQFTLRTAMHMAMGKKFLNWSVQKPIKCMFFSLEMPHGPLKFLTDTMIENMPYAEKEAIGDMFHLWTGGYGLKLDDTEDQKSVLEAVKEIKPDAIFIDSFGQALSDDMNSPQAVNKVFTFLRRELTMDNDAFVWFVHHNRKSQGNNKKPKTLDDLFGSRYISANTDTGIGLWPAGNEIEILKLKTRLTEKTNDQMFITRTKHLDFRQGRVRTNPNIYSKNEVQGEDDFLGF